MIDLMLRRRTVRRFTDKPVSPEQIERLLQAGLLAPSSLNKHPVRLFVVTDPATISAMVDCKHAGTMALKTATLVIIVAADSQISDVWIEDAAIAATHILLEAEALGLGCNWIHLRNRKTNTGESSAEWIRRQLSIPETLQPSVLLCFGNKAVSPEPYTLESLQWEHVSGFPEK